MKKSKTYCRYLRAKNAYGTLEGGDKPFIPVDTGTTSYWCILSMSPVGPDGQISHISTCQNKERMCFEEPQTAEE